MRKLLPLALPLFALSLVAVGCGDESDDGGSGGGGGSKTSQGGDTATDPGTGGGTNSNTGGSTGTGGSGGGVTPKNPIAEDANSPTDAECNMAGVWMMRTTVTSEANSADQVAKRWYFYEVSQDGDVFQINVGLSCQVHVETVPWNAISGARVTMSDGAIQGVLDRNSHKGTQGTFVKNGNECDFALDRIYSVRGVGPDGYLPTDPTAGQDLSDLEPLPVLPADADTAAKRDAWTDPDVTDWDGQGQNGLRWEIDALLDGWRSGAQRDMQDHYSVSGDATYGIALDSTEFTTKLDIDMEEEVYHFSNDLMASVATLKDVDHFGVWKRLGDSRADVTDLPTTDIDICKWLEAEYPFGD